MFVCAPASVQGLPATGRGKVRSVQAQNHSSDREVNDQARCVTKCRNERVGENGRVGADFLRQDGHEPAHGRGHRADTQQGEPNDGTQLEPVNEARDQEP